MNSFDDFCQFPRHIYSRERKEIGIHKNCTLLSPSILFNFCDFESDNIKQKALVKKVRGPITNAIDTVQPLREEVTR